MLCHVQAIPQPEAASMYLPRRHIVPVFACRRADLAFEFKHAEYHDRLDLLGNVAWATVVERDQKVDGPNRGSGEMELDDEPDVLPHHAFEGDAVDDALDLELPRLRVLEVLDVDRSDVEDEALGFDEAMLADVVQPGLEIEQVVDGKVVELRDRARRLEDDGVRLTPAEIDGLLPHLFASRGDCELVLSCPRRDFGFIDGDDYVVGAVQHQIVYLVADFARKLTKSRLILFASSDRQSGFRSGCCSIDARP